MILFLTGKLIFHKFENAFTLDKKSWGFIRDMEVMSFKELLENVITTVCFGGKYKLKMSDEKNTTLMPIP